MDLTACEWGYLNQQRWVRAVLHTLCAVFSRQLQPVEQAPALAALELQHEYLGGDGEEGKEKMCG